MHKKYFCTFADSRMKDSLSRIERQARDMDTFDVISVNNESDLDSSFKEEFKDKLVKGSRGYGYWVWKPQIILQMLERMDEGDVLLYADAGCHLNKGGAERLKQYFEKAASSPSGIFAFQEAVETEDKSLSTFYGHLERYYTKGDTFDYFEARANANFYDTGMIAATCFFVRKCDSSVRIIREWLNIFRTRFDLVDDTPSASANFEGFIENRHDQSIFSMLCKKNNVQTVSAYEMWQSDWRDLDSYPIHAKRDKALPKSWRAAQKVRSAIKRTRSFWTTLLRGSAHSPTDIINSTFGILHMDSFQDYENPYADNRFYHMLKASQCREFISQNASPTKTFLDAGAGRGPYTRMAQGKYAKVYCFEYDANELAIAKKNIGTDQTIDFKQVDITDIPLESSSIDVAVCSEVLEHIPDNSKAISELHRVLRPGGMLLFSMPNKMSMLYVTSWFKNRKTLKTLGNWPEKNGRWEQLRHYAFGPAEIEGLATGAGFTILKRRGPHVLRLPSSVRKFMMFRLPAMFRAYVQINGILGKSIPQFSSFYFLTLRKEDR